MPVLKCTMAKGADIVRRQLIGVMMPLEGLVVLWMTSLMEVNAVENKGN